MKEYKEKKIAIELKNTTKEDYKVPEFKLNEIVKNKEIDLKTLVEGLLFVVGDEGITLDQLEIVLEKDVNIITTIVDKLIEKYSLDSYPIEIVGYGGKFKFLSKNIMHPYIEKLFNNTKPSSLSQSALETLAIIAYKQPITRVEIEEIRGVGADMMLRKLQARNLIKENGRSDAPGRPILYGVTEEFMDSFKLISMDELPDLPTYHSDEADDLFEQ